MKHRVFMLRKALSAKASLSLLAVFLGIQNGLGQLNFYDVHVGLVHGTTFGDNFFELTGVTSYEHATPGTEFAGSLSLTVTPIGSSSSTTFQSYCIGLYEMIGVPNNYTGAPRAIPEPSTSIDPSFAIPDATRRAAVLYTTYAAAAAGDKWKEAALQTAIWKSMYQDFAFTGVTGFDSTQVTAFKNQVDAYYGILGSATLTSSAYNANQWVFYTYNAPDPQSSTLLNDQYLIGPIAVPEPEHIGVAVVLGLAALGGYEKYQRRNRTQVHSLPPGSGEICVNSCPGHGSPSSRSAHFTTAAVRD
jgi:hypothetical protein